MSMADPEKPAIKHKDPVQVASPALDAKVEGIMLEGGIFVMTSPPYSQVVPEDRYSTRFPDGHMILLTKMELSAAAQAAEKFFGHYTKEQRKEVVAELEASEFEWKDVKGFLNYLFASKIPPGFEVIKDTAMKQVYFIKPDVIDYMMKHNPDMSVRAEEGKCIDSQDIALAMADNPNIRCRTLFRGNVVVATLAKLFSGRPLDDNAVYGMFKDDPNREHRYEHDIERTLNPDKL